MRGRKSRITEEAVVLWNDGLMSSEQIGIVFGVTGRSVLRYLTNRGIRTDKGQIARPVSCVVCGTVRMRTRCWRRKTRKAYCSRQCYYKALHNPEYQRSVYGMRKARAFVKTQFCLEQKHVVHHIDGNSLNNEPGNLMVFGNQGDHLRWHRLDGEKSGVKALWP